MRWHENNETAKLNQKNHSGAAGAAGQQEQGCYRQAEGGGGVAKENMKVKHNNNSQVSP